jgi:hypothetical protein
VLLARKLDEARVIILELESERGFGSSSIGIFKSWSTSVEDEPHGLG